MPGLFDGTSWERPALPCEKCGRALEACVCPQDNLREQPLPGDQQPRVRREKRRGKWCAIVSDIQADRPDLKSLLKNLRTQLGTGGGISNNELVIQGDHRDAIVAHLIDLGYRAKASGG